MILISYDGSADADAAIDHLAALMPGAEATVVTVWQPFIDSMAHNGAAMGVGFGMTSGYGLSDSDSIDATIRDKATQTALEGAERAVAAGLVATGRAVSREADIAGTVLAVAAEIDADLIVLGTRGRGSVKAWLLGSVSHGVVQQADRAVLVVPSPELSERRHGHAHGAAAHA